MNEHQIRCFLLVAEEGSFSAAAKRCGVSQPAVSKTIAALEGELGLRLFSREGSKRIELTETGVQYLAFFQDAAVRWAELRSEIGLVDAPLRFALPACLEGLVSVPKPVGREVTPCFLPPKELSAALKKGQVDFVFCPEDWLSLGKRYAFTFAGKSETVVLYSPVHFQRFDRQLMPVDFADSVCYLVAGEAFRPMNRLQEKACLTFGFMPRVVYLADWAAILKQVGAGKGFTLCHDFCAAEYEQLAYVGLNAWQVFLLACQRKLPPKLCDEALHAVRQIFP